MRLRNGIFFSIFLLVIAGSASAALPKEGTTQGGQTGTKSVAADPVEPKRQSCEKVEKNLDAFCAAQAKNKDTKQDPRCENGKLKDKERLSVESTNAGVKCVQEKKITEETHNTACSNEKNVQTTADPNTCKNGITKMFPIEGLTKERAQKAGIKCFEEGNEKNAKGETVKMVTICNDKEDQDKLKTLTQQASRSRDDAVLTDALTKGDQPKSGQPQTQAGGDAQTAADRIKARIEEGAQRRSQGELLGAGTQVADAGGTKDKMLDAPVVPVSDSIKGAQSATSVPQNGTGGAPAASSGGTTGGTTAGSTGGGASTSGGTGGAASGGTVAGGAAAGGSAGGTSAGVASTGGAVSRGDTGGVAGGPRGGSLADSSRPSQMPTYTSQQPSPGVGGGYARGGSSLGASNFFSQFFGGGASAPAVSTSSGAGYAQTYTVPTYASQAPTQAQLTQAQRAALLALPKTTLRTQQSSTSALDAIAALANDASTTKKGGLDTSTIEALLAQQDTTPAKTLAGDTSQDKLLALLSSSATPEELVAADKKKQAANDKELRDTIAAINKQSAQTSTEQKAPVEVAYVAPSDQVARTTGEQQAVQKLAFTSNMVTAANAGNSSIPDISVDAVRTDIVRRVAPMLSRLDSGALTARERDQFAADLYSRVEWVETAAYGKQYEVSVVLTSLSKQLEHAALLLSQNASVEKIRSALTSIHASLGLLPAAQPSTIITLADLPLEAGDWSLRHLSFYATYTEALANKATNARARALFLDAHQLVSFDMSIGGVASSQRNVVADIDAARNKVTLGKSLERDAAAQQKATSPQDVTQSPGLWDGFKALFGF